MKLKDLETIEHLLNELLGKTNLPHYPSVGSMEELNKQLEKDRKKTVTVGEVFPLVAKIAQNFHEIRRKVRIEEAYRTLREEGELDSDERDRCGSDDD